MKYGHKSPPKGSSVESLLTAKQTKVKAGIAATKSGKMPSSPPNKKNKPGCY